MNYREGDAAAAIRDLAPDGVDLVVEVAPAQNLRLDVRVIKPRGTIAIYANNGGDEVTLSVRETFSTNARFQWVLLYTVGQAALRAAAEDITAAVADGGVRRRRRARPAAAPLPARADRRRRTPPSRTARSARC